MVIGNTDDMVLNMMVKQRINGYNREGEGSVYINVYKLQAVTLIYVQEIEKGCQKRCFVSYQ